MSLLFVLLLAAGVVVLRERARRQRTGGARATGGEVAISCGVASAVAGGAELARLLFTHSTWTVDGVPLSAISFPAATLRNAPVTARTIPEICHPLPRTRIAVLANRGVSYTVDILKL